MCLCLPREVYLRAHTKFRICCSQTLCFSEKPLLSTKKSIARKKAAIPRRLMQPAAILQALWLCVTAFRLFCLLILLIVFSLPHLFSDKFVFAKECAGYRATGGFVLHILYAVYTITLYKNYSIYPLIRQV